MHKNQDFQNEKCIKSVIIWLGRQKYLFLSDTDSNDTVFFYFTGHGTTIDGRHYLGFSDGYLDTQSVIDLFEKMKVKKRLLLLDCCMSVNVHVSKWVESLAGDGTAVLASSLPCLLLIEFIKNWLQLFKITTSLFQKVIGISASNHLV